VHKGPRQALLARNKRTGEVLLVWRLRAYGGEAVSETRDAAEAALVRLIATLRAEVDRMSSAIDVQHEMIADLQKSLRESVARAEKAERDYDAIAADHTKRLGQLRLAESDLERSTNLHATEAALWSEKAARYDSLEADCAAMRNALESIVETDDTKSSLIAEDALSTNSGAALLRYVEALEKGVALLPEHHDGMCYWDCASQCFQRAQVRREISEAKKECGR
jgi:chromosome segregation ATPase